MIARRRRLGSKYQLTTHLAVVLLLLVMFISAGFYLLVVKPGSPDTDSAQRYGLDSARATWDTHRPRRFRYVVDRQCDCPIEERQPFVVTEEGLKVTARFAIPLESSTGELLTGPADVASITRLFAIAEVAIVADEVIELAFDANFGFPSRTHFTNSGKTVLIEVRDFEVLEYR